ncbi:protein FANTASTIC FOUR 3 [Mercurialis annua]|uniref:protein FANTASTIC FOUR 3 n=1 Tax=Mercurialis annua TaxID=3986 RepID=UPI00215EEFB7|nr:protein FANTASTIC FOUR 3 [Mercurialis annua]
MATVVCQGLQSCLESQIVESRTLTLRLCSSKSFDSTNNIQANSVQNNPDAAGGWSFLQVLPSSSSMENKENNNVYVHPLIKRYSLTLSEKSLELCTENLGSETGSTDVIEPEIFTYSASESESELEQKQPEKQPKKGNYIRSFPPPLTTMSGSESLQVRPHREDGRLIIEAVVAPPKRSYFQAERSGGRLRLCFVGDSDSNIDPEEETEFEDDEEEDDEVEEQNGAFYTEEMRNCKNLEEQFQRRRCKEDEIEKIGLLNWEPFNWVATS